MPKKGEVMSPEQKAKILARRDAFYAQRTHKICPRCSQELPLENFSLRPVRGGGGRLLPNSYCRPCERAYAVQRQKAYIEKYPERNRARQLKVDLRIKYGMTPEDYDALLAEQGGRCAICGSDSPRRSNATRFTIDHDHSTGAVRGLLCSPCNLGLGGFSDDPDTVLLAWAYLKEHLTSMETT